MTKAKISHTKLIQLDQYGESILGFTILRAVASVFTKGDYQPREKQYQGGFVATMRIKGIDMSFSAIENNAIVVGNRYRKVQLKATASRKTSLSEVDSVMSTFISHFKDFLAIELMEPEQELERRICSFDHQGARVTVTFDEDMQLWWCQEHGMNYEEDTRIAPVNPFIL